MSRARCGPTRSKSNTSRLAFIRSGLTDLASRSPSSSSKRSRRPRHCCRLRAAPPRSKPRRTPRPYAVRTTDARSPPSSPWPTRSSTPRRSSARRVDLRGVPPENVQQTVEMLMVAQENETDMVTIDAARKAIADCDRRMKSHRSTLDAGRRPPGDRPMDGRRSRESERSQKGRSES